MDYVMISLQSLKGTHTTMPQLRLVIKICFESVFVKICVLKQARDEEHGLWERWQRERRQDSGGGGGGGTPNQNIL